MMRDSFLKYMVVSSNGAIEAFINDESSPRALNNKISDHQPENPSGNGLSGIEDDNDYVFDQGSVNSADEDQDGGQTSFDSGNHDPSSQIRSRPLNRLYIPRLRPLSDNGDPINRIRSHNGMILSLTD